MTNPLAGCASRFAVAPAVVLGLVGTAPTFAAEQAAPVMAMPWERELVGLELLLVQPVFKRVIGVERSPDVPLPKPIEGSLGHVFLRLVDAGPSAQQLAVGVGAWMDVDGDGVDDPSRIGKGLFGGLDRLFGTHIGYDLRLQVLPLAQVAGDYARHEARWLRRYPLPTTTDERAALQAVLARAWQDSEAHALGSYSFFSENCATELSELLNEVLLGRAREFNFTHTLPRKYRRRGFLLRAVATVTPEQSLSPAFEEHWAPLAGLYELCAEGDADCAADWVAAAAALSPEQRVDLARDLDRRRARRRFASAVRGGVAALADPSP